MFPVLIDLPMTKCKRAHIQCSIALSVRCTEAEHDTELINVIACPCINGQEEDKLRIMLVFAGLGLIVFYSIEGESEACSLDH